MKRIILLLVLVVVFCVVSCMTPAPMSVPAPQEPTGSGDKSFKKKMCVGHDCRKMGAVDGGGTTRGHHNDEDD